MKTARTTASKREMITAALMIMVTVVAVLSVALMLPQRMTKFAEKRGDVICAQAFSQLTFSYPGY